MILPIDLDASIVPSAPPGTVATVEYTCTPVVQDTLPPFVQDTTAPI
jgi:hypothetical protein